MTKSAVEWLLALEIREDDDLLLVGRSSSGGGAGSQGLASDAPPPATRSATSPAPTVASASRRRRSSKEGGLISGATQFRGGPWAAPAAAATPRASYARAGSGFGPNGASGSATPATPATPAPFGGVGVGSRGLSASEPPRLAAARPPAQAEAASAATPATPAAEQSSKPRRLHRRLSMPLPFRSSSKRRSSSAGGSGRFGRAAPSMSQLEAPRRPGEQIQSLDV